MLERIVTGMSDRVRAVLFCASLAMKAAPRGSFVILLLGAVQGAISPAMVWVTKLVVDQLSAGTGQQWAGQLLFLAVGYALLVAASSVAPALASMIQGNVNDRVLHRLNMNVFESTDRLVGLARFEDPDHENQITRVRSEASHLTRGVLLMVVRALQHCVSIASLGVLASRLHIMLPVALIISHFPIAIHTEKVRKLTFDLEERLAEERRRLDYMFTMSLNPYLAKEIRLFGLKEWVTRRYLQQLPNVEEPLWRLRKRTLFAGMGASAIRVLGIGASLAWVIAQGLQGKILAGDAILILGVVLHLPESASQLVRIWDETGQLAQGAARIQSFLSSAPDLPVPAHPRSLPPKLSQGIVVKDVWFRYPGATKYTLKGVTFSIRPGESVALVGENGAGKSTLVKLLTRMYDPTAGSIYYDGIDLRECDPQEVRRRIAVVFQDFSRWSLTLGENIGVGDVEHINDHERIVAAARKSDADRIANQLAQGYNTRLGKPFGGVELSGGEWQKVALARAFMRKAEVLILDEPTAALDVRTEYELYRRFAKLTQDKATLLISHRLSTTRMADRIIVLEDGRIIEDGSHDELMRVGKRYAHLFKLQAEGYTSRKEGTGGASKDREAEIG